MNPLTRALLVTALPLLIGGCIVERCEWTADSEPVTDAADAADPSGAESD